MNEVGWEIEIWQVIIQRLGRNPSESIVTLRVTLCGSRPSVLRARAARWLWFELASVHIGALVWLQLPRKSSEAMLKEKPGCFLHYYLIIHLFREWYAITLPTRSLIKPIYGSKTDCVHKFATKMQIWLVCTRIYSRVRQNEMQVVRYHFLFLGHKTALDFSMFSHSQKT